MIDKRVSNWFERTRNHEYSILTQDGLLSSDTPEPAFTGNFSPARDPQRFITWTSVESYMASGMSEHEEKKAGVRR